MRISHEAIYQALYVQGRGALRRELTTCLRTGRALRMPRERVRGRGKAFLTPEVMISERPASVEDRAVPGHWEGDLILGLDSSAIGTLVERTTRFTMLLHLPRMPGHRQQPRDKQGPALAGHGAEAVRQAITKAMKSLPKQLKKSLTWDQGTEMAQHVKLSIELRLGEKRTGHLQDFVGSAQFFDLALQVLDPLRLGGADAWPSSGIDFILLDPVQQRLGHTANLRRNRLDRSPQRRVLPAVLLDHPNGPLTDLR